MNDKKSTTLRGTLLCPLVVGATALISCYGQLMRTSRIVAIQSVAAGEVRFETMNTHYTLLPDPTPQTAYQPMTLGAVA